MAAVNQTTGKRFAETSADEIISKRLKINADNTIKANRKCANILKEYLTEKGKNAGFESFDAIRLDETLCHFYMDVRKPNGDRYKATSLESIRNGLNRYLKSPPHNKSFDIVKDAAFNDCNTNFKAVLKEVKRLGLGDIEHHPVIDEVDRQRLYTSMYLSSETPTGLFNKVQFDIRLYFCRRGQENMHSMTKSTFSVKTDNKTGLKYVTKTQDELTKNHRETSKELVSGVMPESPGSVYCPVTSYEKYISKLNPVNDRLWQKPLDSFTPDIDFWYCNIAVGEKKLSSFMSYLSNKCKLSTRYTNHSIRATGATLLAKNMYGSAQIMAVTGHKSVQSLTTYQRVDTDDKIKMGRTLSENLVAPSAATLALPSTATLALPSTATLALPSTATLALPSTATLALPPSGEENIPPKSSTSATSLDIMEQLRDIDFDELFGEFHSNQSLHQTSARSNHQIFYGNVTVIQNLTINK